MGVAFVVVVGVVAVDVALAALGVVAVAIAAGEA